MITLSAHLKTVALTVQERWRYFSQGLIRYPTTVNTDKKAASPRTPRRHAGPQTKAVLKVADERETFTIDDLPPLDRRHLASVCQHLVKKGELRRIQAGRLGGKEWPPYTAAVKTNDSPQLEPPALQRAAIEEITPNSKSKLQCPIQTQLPFRILKAQQPTRPKPRIFVNATSSSYYIYSAGQPGVHSSTGPTGMVFGSRL